MLSGAAGGLYEFAMTLTRAKDEFVEARYGYRQSGIAKDAVGLVEEYIHDAPAQTIRGGADELVQVIRDFDEGIDTSLPMALATVTFQAQAAANIAALTDLQQAFMALEGKWTNPERARAYLDDLNADQQVSLVKTARTSQLIGQATQLADSSTQLVSQREEALRAYVREHVGDFNPRARAVRVFWRDLRLEAFLEGVRTIVEVGMPVAALALGVAVPPLAPLAVAGAVGVATTLGIKIGKEFSKQGQREHLYGRAGDMLMLLDPLKEENANAEDIVALFGSHTSALEELRQEGRLA